MLEQIIVTSELTKSQKIEIIELWNSEYPEKLAYKSPVDFDVYLNDLAHKSHIILINENQIVIGWYLDFVRNEEKWFVIILDSKYQGKGYGTMLLNKGKEKEPVLNGWVIDHDNDKKLNGEFYKSPLGFYLRNGFELHANERLELDKISAVKIKWIKNNDYSSF